ncbi:hypothetical protein PUR29_14085 [Methylobacterium ajmalii]|uniref:Uncharacterized protein n=1 Tax=Methylobacterium ajmalii TaxID=2738439 RepID=A0ABU9ZU41_9HYPH
MRRIILAGLIALLPAVALARAPMETNQLVDGAGNPIGTPDNPLVTTGGGGGAGSTGSVTAPGTSGSQAQAVQGINGGVPLPIQGGNATPVKTDGSATTQPVSAASLPLPAGAATAANQTASTAAPGSVPSLLVGIQGGGGNAIPILTSGGQYFSSMLTRSDGQSLALVTDLRGQAKISETGSSDPLVGIVPAVTQAGTSVVGKASQGNLYSAYAVNGTTTAGYLACINAAAVPAAGAAIAPLDVAALAGTVGATAALNYGAGPPNGYTAGIVCLVTTSLTTYTAGGNAFIQARVR